MKKILSILFILSLSIGLIGCGSDDNDNKDSKEATLKEQYESISTRIKNQETKIESIEQSCSSQTSGRDIIKCLEENEVPRLKSELEDLIREKEEIEKKLGI